MNIYDSKGKLVFEISSNDKWNWDGNLKNGQAASPGNYFYAIYALGFDNQKYQVKGSLYLNR